MSSSYSAWVEFSNDPQGPTEEEFFEGRIWYHHTSDTVAWQVRRKGADDVLLQKSFGDSEWDAFMKAARAKPEGGEK